MDTPTVSPQEKLSATLASLFFLAPLMMGKKTEYVVKYMKQGFFINVVELIATFLGMILWFIPGIFGLVSFVAFCASLVLMPRAYAGEDRPIIWIYENAEKLIQNLSLVSFFSPDTK